MKLILKSECRRTTTPNATMTTLASPTQGGAGQAIWRVDMAPASQGPRHYCDTEQIWTVLTGSGDIEVDGRSVTVSAGDVLIVAAQAARQVSAGADAGMSAIVTAPARPRVHTSRRPAPMTPAWME